MMVLILLIVMSMISMMILLLANALSKKNLLSQEKSSPFECGFNPFKKSRIPFSLHFFLIALIFIIFDIEIILLIPSPLIPSPSKYILISMILFITILMMGLFHEWKQGSINWV